jgi:hypothetical protein
MTDDRFKIMNQIARWGSIADLEDIDTYVEIFTEEDGRLEVFLPGKLDTPAFVGEGRENLRVSMKAMLARREGKHLKVLLGLPIFDEVTADTARTRTEFLSYWKAEDANGQQLDLAMSSFYHDEWQRTKAGWLIKCRIEHSSSAPRDRTQ